MGVAKGAQLGQRFVVLGSVGVLFGDDADLEGCGLSFSGQLGDGAFTGVDATTVRQDRLAAVALA